jgi:ATP-binding cassette subfamily G (WHITE) protein 2
MYSPVLSARLPHSEQLHFLQCSIRPLCFPLSNTQVTLLSAGRLVYNGPSGGLAVWLSTAFGVPYDPTQHGLPPDFALSLVSLVFGGALAHDEHRHHEGGHEEPGSGSCSSGADGGGAEAGDNMAKAERRVVEAAELFRRQQAVEAAAGHPPPLPRDANNCADARHNGFWKAAAASGCLPDWRRRGQVSAARPSPGAAGFWSQFATLLRRELLLATRDPADVAGRTLTFVYVAALVGVCFYSLPTSAAGARVRLADSARLSVVIVSRGGCNHGMRGCLA